jgi:Tol biopolymer transport system component
MPLTAKEAVEMTTQKTAKVAIVAAVVTASAAACLIGVSPSGATFRGDNGLLVYQAQAGKHIQLFTIRADGTGNRQITHLRHSDAISPEWSPDGRRIVFARDYALGTRHEHLDIVTLNPNGSGLRGMGLRGLNGDPTWSPHGRILWVHPGGFAVSRAHGSGFRMLRVAGDNSSPTFAPDGRQIAFRRQLRGRRSAIFVVGANGGRARRVVAPAGGVADKIDWSPDGSRIVFSAPVFGQAGQPSSNVFTIQPDGSGLRQLTHAQGGKVNNGADSWSPDGKRIAFVSNPAGAYQIYVMNADGTDATAVTHTAPGGHLAAWGTHP